MRQAEIYLIHLKIQLIQPQNNVYHCEHFYGDSLYMKYLVFSFYP